MDAANFWSYVDMRGPDRCWPWVGTVDPNGYGRTKVQAFATRLAHRIAFSLANGDPGKLCVLHSCDNPPCCNPAHLRAGTRADNNGDTKARGRWNWRGKRQTPVGSQHHAARMTEELVAEIRRSTESHVELAKKYDVSPGTIEYVRRIGWKHVKVKAKTPVNGRSVATRGENNATAKLTENDIRAIRASTEKPGKVAVQYGIIPDYVTLIRKRKVWKHVE